MTTPSRIISYLKRRKHHTAPAKDIARVLGLPSATVSLACNRLAWNQTLDYVVIPNSGRMVGVWRLRKETGRAR